ncbi:ORFX protein [Cacao swollen shoot Ghana K virus]|uniref:ORFX protein n=1 Tax=Cacao swollen shoot Ghana K virus TaxID=2056881 RepID=UPI000CA14BB5|nr:ORFX protein [Cacao swollen shoot Ghana K virus]ATZ69473.1 ORFX protein [Cacao swollen shoot Ghana K virus]
MAMVDSFGITLYHRVIIMTLKLLLLDGMMTERKKKSFLTVDLLFNQKTRKKMILTINPLLFNKKMRMMMTLMSFGHVYNEKKRNVVVSSSRKA